jgi:hypothetical protein
VPQQTPPGPTGTQGYQPGSYNGTYTQPVP